ncbi:MAG TPA: response regulator transcription factor [Longimicrobiales bacterium]|nr:response regulator transcription factor [Longimicrobiales bacterium]
MVRAEPIRVLIADDHAVVREGIRSVLGTDERFEVVGEAVAGRQAVSLSRKLEPDVVVLDLSMPELSGFEAAEQIRRAVPAARILVLSIHDHEEYVARSVQAGAHGYLLKDSSPVELRDAVRLLSEGQCYFMTPAGRAGFPDGERESGATDTRARLAQLTCREREVLVEIARGLSNKEIAARINVSVRTVESHREAVMRKLGLRGTAALTRFALDGGLLD